MSDRVKVTIHRKRAEAPLHRPSPRVLTAIYVSGGTVILILVAFFSYLLFFHASQEQVEVNAVVSRFVQLVNSKDNNSAMQMIDSAWYQVTNQQDTLAFLQQVEGLGQVKLGSRRKFSSEGVEGTVAYEVAYSGTLGGQSAEISFRLIRRGQVLFIQAFRLE